VGVGDVTEAGATVATKCAVWAYDAAAVTVVDDAGCDHVNVT
jgi:hypothetical protein